MRVISGIAKGTKLETLEGNETRPTLDRVKEALFNMLQNRIRDAYVLDLFSGSGALGIEALSRGAKFCALCDKSNNMLKIDYKFDLIFVDPPYKLDIAVSAIKSIIELNLLSEDGIIILETDDEQREQKALEKTNVNVYDLRKYGRVKLIFLNRKG